VTEDVDRIAVHAADLAEELAPFFDALAGKGPQIQGAVLVQLIARFIAGHVVLESPAETAKIRKAQLDLLAVAAWHMVPIAAKEIGAEP
jgi:hypothetical protein